MLDLLRRNASSWLIKVVLGAIILSFVLVFGYSQLSSQNFGGDSAASVNGQQIPLKLYRLTYDQIYDNFKQSLGSSSDGVPDFAQRIAQNNAMRQLIQRAVLIEQAKQNDVNISDEELANNIVQNLSNGENDFDPIAYRHEFLPQVSRNIGMNYEKYIRQNLASIKIQSSLANLTLPLAPNLQLAKDLNNLQWTFKVLNIPHKTADKNQKDEQASTKDQNNPISAAEIATQFLANTSKQDWDKLAKSHNISIREVGPINISQRQQVISKKLTLENHLAIFALNDANSVLQAPIKHDDGSVSIVKLVKRAVKKPLRKTSSKKGKNQTSDEELTSLPTVNFFSQWIQQALSQAEVESFLDQQ